MISSHIPPKPPSTKDRSLVHDIALRVATLVVLFSLMAGADRLGSGARVLVWSGIVVAVGYESWRIVLPRTAWLGGVAVLGVSGVLACALPPGVLAVGAAALFVGSWMVRPLVVHPVCWLPIVAFGAACLLVVLQRSSGSLLLVFTLLQCHDIVAYLVGRLAGRRRIAPRLSPGKTLEGTASGVLALLLGVGAAVFWGAVPQRPVVLAVGLSAVALLGDLWFSRIKRRHGLSDFGAALPGHGGFTDRFDSMIFAGIPWLVAS